jgi:hypothetical protein
VERNVSTAGETTAAFKLGCGPQVDDSPYPQGFDNFKIGRRHPVERSRPIDRSTEHGFSADSFVAAEVSEVEASIEPNVSHNAIHAADGR